MNFVKEYVKLNKRSESPDLFHKWGAIFIIAALKNKQIYYNLDDHLYANMFIIYVGKPAAKKGTAMKKVKWYLDELNIHQSSESGSEKGIIMHLKKQKESTGDANIVYVLSELSLFLEGKEKTIIPRLCSLYDCESVKWSTQHSGIEIIDSTSTSILGGIQPETMREGKNIVSIMLKSGLASRIIFVFPDPKGSREMHPAMNEKEKRNRAQLLKHLEDIVIPVKGEMIFTGQTRQFYEKWAENFLERRENESGVKFDTSVLDGYCERRRGHMIKISMCLAAADGSNKISLENAKDAVEILNETERYMKRIWYGTGQSPLSHVVADIREILRFKNHSSKEEICNKCLEDADVYMVEQALETMMQAGIVKRLNGEDVYALRKKA